MILVAVAHKNYRASERSTDLGVVMGITDDEGFGGVDSEFVEKSSGGLQFRCAVVCRIAEDSAEMGLDLVMGYGFPQEILRIGGEDSLLKSPGREFTEHPMSALVEVALNLARLVPLPPGGVNDRMVESLRRKPKMVVVVSYRKEKIPPVVVNIDRRAPVRDEYLIGDFDGQLNIVQ